MVSNEFFWVSGALWLDAVNSEVIRNEERIDCWPNMSALERWLRFAGQQHSEAAALQQFSAPSNVTVGQEILQSAKHLRAALRIACERVHSGQQILEEELNVVNQILGRQGSISRLVNKETGWVEVEELYGGPQDVLYFVARSAARSWVKGDLARLKPCTNPACILWFLDTSKNGTRRWCSMEACGNRHKAATHYQRTRSQGNPT